MKSLMISLVCVLPLAAAESGAESWAVEAGGADAKALHEPAWAPDVADAWRAPDGLRGHADRAWAGADARHAVAAWAGQHGKALHGWKAAPEARAHAWARSWKRHQAAHHHAHAAA